MGDSNFLIQALHRLLAMHRRIDKVEQMVEGKVKQRKKVRLWSV
ncbi:MAG: hypothetical protein WBY71_06985 [Nitrososphaeraceae archaeon]